MIFRYTKLAFLLCASTLLGSVILASIPVKTQAYSSLSVDAQDESNALVASGGLDADSLRQTAQGVTVLINHSGQFGSGVIVSKSDNTYYVLTASHVVNTDGSTQVTTFNSQSHVGTVLARNISGLDLALLSFNSQQSYSVATIADYPLTRSNIGESVNHLYISGWSGGQEYRISCGVLLPDFFLLMLRQDPVTNGYEIAYTNETSSGLSGSPIFNRQGKIIGIHGRVEGEEFDAVGSINLGLSLGIPAQRIVQALKENSIAIHLSTENKIPNIDFSSSDQSFCEPEVSAPYNSPNPIAWANYANSLLRQLRLEEALQAYDKALERNINGELYQLRYARGLTLILLQRPNEAFENFETARTLWSQLPTEQHQNSRARIAHSLILRYQGLALTDRGDYQAALAAYDEALEITPNNRHLLLLRAGILNRLGRQEEVVTIYNELMRDNSDPSLLALYSNLFTQSDDVALENLNHIIQANPNYAPAYANRGAIRKRMGDLAGANSDYERVREIVRESAPEVDAFINYPEMLIRFAEASASIDDNPAAAIGILLDSVESDAFQGFFNSEAIEDLFSLYLNNEGNDIQGFTDVYEELFEGFISEAELSQSDTSSARTTLELAGVLEYVKKAANDAIFGNSLSEAKIDDLRLELDRIIQQDNNVSGLYLAYAISSALHQQDSNERASRQDFGNAIQLANTSSEFEVFAGRGLTHLAVGNRQDAISDLQMAAQLAREQNGFEEYDSDIYSFYGYIMTVLDQISY